jgi:hypothetical protein
MARKSSSSLGSARRSKVPEPATLLARFKEAADTKRAPSLIELVEQRALIESLLVDLGDVVDRLDRANDRGRLSSEDRKIGSHFRRGEARATHMLRCIEDRIAQTSANTIEDAVLKLTVYGKLQGYEFNKGARRRDVTSIDERLFFSVLADLKRFSAVRSRSQRQQSSDRKRSIKARK